MTMCMKLKEENETGQILGFIKALTTCNLTRNEIKSKLKTEFQLSSTEAEERLLEYEDNLQLV